MHCLRSWTRIFVRLCWFRFFLLRSLINFVCINPSNLWQIYCDYLFVFKWKSAFCYQVSYQRNQMELFICFETAGKFKDMSTFLSPTKEEKKNRSNGSDDISNWHRVGVFNHLLGKYQISFATTMRFLCSRRCRSSWSLGEIIIFFEENEIMPQLLVCCYE